MANKRAKAASKATRRQTAWQTAGGVTICPHTERVLLIKTRKDGWTFPKGRVGRRESPRAAGLRETREESGYRVRPVKRLGALREGRALRHYWLYTLDCKRPRARDDEALDVRFFSLAQAKKKLHRERDRLVFAAARRALRELTR